MNDLIHQLRESTEWLSASALEQLQTANENCEILISQAKDEIHRLQALHLERTKLTSKMIAERDKARIELGHAKAFGEATNDSLQLCRSDLAERDKVARDRLKRIEQLEAAIYRSET